MQIELVDRVERTFRLQKFPDFTHYKVHLRVCCVHVFFQIVEHTGTGAGVWVRKDSYRRSTEL